MKITIPELSLVVLIGPSGSGKSTFARQHFKPTEILSSDFCRGLVADDENAQFATKDAFEVLHFIAAKRLAAARLTVVDATNVQEEARKSLLVLARQYHVLPTAIVLNMPERVCHERNTQRPDRDFGPHVVRQHSQQLRRSLRGLQKEGFRHVFVLDSPEEVDVATVVRQSLWNNLKHEHGPFDIIGDVHGCCDELETLLAKLGYETADALETKFYTHPQGRKAFFVGDLVDRGPRVLDTLQLVRNMMEHGTALCVPGNHDMKLLRKLNGKDVKVSHGMEQTLAEIAALAEDERAAFCQETAKFLDSLVSHYVLDDGKLVVAHAGLSEELHGRTSGRVRAFALYGETTGETDEFGLPVRYNWASEYRGKAFVVYGHTPVPEPQWLNGTINIDTGCVFGGQLTALRYPENELVSVPAQQVYAEPARPFLLPSQPTDGLSAQQQQDDVLDIADVLGKRLIATRLIHNITVRGENATAALEVMSRFAANPKWLIYLPPTMSPSETSRQPGLLEHPAEAFAYYRNQGVAEVICEEKHMGSRAIVVVCRDEAATRARFGVVEPELGICYTRTGRRFFDNATLEREFLETVRDAATHVGFWEEFNTEWLCLDCELMPWSVKAQELLRQQYAAVGAASRIALPAAVAALQQAAVRADIEPTALLALRERYQERQEMASLYVDAYRHYCWPAPTLAGLKLAPFHLLATEGVVHMDKDHVWHMETLARLCGRDDAPDEAAHPLLLATPYKIVQTGDEASQQAGIQWWEALTRRGGEGMVVKPLQFIAQGQRGLIQPAVKCRGREYLRIIYGPEYTASANLERLRARGLSAKRALALREFALGIESLERFTRREPLRRIHECVFGVLALESEPVDPRL